MTAVPRIQRLGRDDIATMYALLDMFGAAFGDEDTYGRARPDRAWLEQLLGSEGFITLAAVRDNAVLGAWPPTSR